MQIDRIRTCLGNGSKRGNYFDSGWDVIQEIQENMRKNGYF